MSNNRIQYYNSELKSIVREMRDENPISEVILWKNLKNKALGVEFYKHIMIDDTIVDFYCHELLLVLEVRRKGTGDNFSCDNQCIRKLESLGIKIIMIDDHDIKKFIYEVISSLEMIIWQRGEELRKKEYHNEL